MKDTLLEIVLVMSGIIVLILLFIFVKVEQSEAPSDNLFQETLPIKQISAATLYYMAPPTNSVQVKTYKDWGYQEPSYAKNS